MSDEYLDQGDRAEIMERIEALEKEMRHLFNEVFDCNNESRIDEALERFHELDLKVILLKKVEPADLKKVLSKFISVVDKRCNSFWNNHNTAKELLQELAGENVIGTAGQYPRGEKSAHAECTRGEPPIDSKPDQHKIISTKEAIENVNKHVTEIKEEIKRRDEQEDSELHDLKPICKYCRSEVKFIEYGHMPDDMYCKVECPKCGEIDFTDLIDHQGRTTIYEYDVILSRDEFNFMFRLAHHDVVSNLQKESEKKLDKIYWKVVH